MRRIFVLGAALAVVFAADASAASSGTYTGTTSQKQKVTLKVSGGKVVRFAYSATYGACGDASGVDKVKIVIKKNKFSATVHPNSEVVDKLSGTFKGNKVTGTITSSLAEGGIHPKTCKTGKLKFSAKL
jgi:hypothetical protein